MVVRLRTKRLLVSTLFVCSAQATNTFLIAPGYAPLPQCDSDDSSDSENEADEEHNDSLVRVHQYQQLSSPSSQAAEADEEAAIDVDAVAREAVRFALHMPINVVLDVSAACS